MKRVFTLFLIAVFALFAAAPVQAAVEYIFADGNTITELEDNDWEAPLRLVNNVWTDFRQLTPIPTDLQANDLVAGVIKFQELNDAYPGVQSSVNLQSTPDTVTALFLIKVASVVADSIQPAFNKITFTPASQGEWTAVFGAGGPIDLSSVFTPTLTTAGTMIFAFDGVSYSDAQHNAGTLADSVSTFLDGARLLYEFGFTGVGDVALADQFWTTVGVDAEDTSAVLDNQPTNRIALGVTAYHPGSLPLLPHNWLGQIAGTVGLPIDSRFTGATELQLKGSFITPGTGSSFPLGTDTDGYIRAIPEPSSFAIACVLGGIFGAASLRRRRANRAA